jgi:alditol oxidase
VNCTAQLGQPGPWFDRLPHFRMGFTPSNGAEIQSEYLLPRENAAAAMAALAPLGEQLARVIQVNEIRTVAADEQWLGLAHGGDAVAFHFTFDRDPDAVREVLGHVEAALLPLGARPHWGKWFVTPREEIEQRYPRIGEFRALAARVDEAGKFRNAFLDTHVL